MNTKSKKKVIFLCIGVINTAFDVSIYTILVSSHVIPFFWANLLSTSVGICCSYILNRKFTFRSSNTSKKQFVGFFGVTSFGLWILQPIVIYLLNSILKELNIVNEGVLLTLLPKIAATSVTLAWNYVLYDRVVFKKFKPVRQE